MCVNLGRVELVDETRCRTMKKSLKQDGHHMAIPAQLAHLVAHPLLGLTYAGFWRRAAATAVDAALLWCLQFGLFSLYEALACPWIETEFGSEGLLMLLVYALLYSIPSALAILLVVPWLYYSLSESSKYQATIGKRIMGLKVIDTDGQRFSFWRSSIKAGLQSVVGLILIYCFGSCFVPTSDPSSALINIYLRLLAAHSLDIPILSAIPLVLAYAGSFLLLVTDQRQPAFDKLVGRLVVVSPSRLCTEF